jgi:hypoxanthine-guanine phosphoribosyltransferase
MSVITDAVKAMKEVLLLTDKVEQAGNTLAEVSKELREHDRRLIRIETFIEIAKSQPVTVKQPKQIQSKDSLET